MPDREVNVLAPQGESLAAAQPGRRKQTEERSIGVWWQRIDGLQGPRRVEQRGNLRWRVDVRLRSVVGATQQSGRRHLVTWIRRREVLREPAHCVDPPCGVLMPRSRCRQRPAYASIRRQRAIVAGRVEIPREKHKLVAGRAKPVPELAPIVHKYYYLQPQYLFSLPILFHYFNREVRMHLCLPTPHHPMYRIAAHDVSGAGQGNAISWSLGQSTFA